MVSLFIHRAISAASLLIFQQIPEQNTIARCQGRQIERTVLIPLRDTWLGSGFRHAISGAGSTTFQLPFIPTPKLFMDFDSFGGVVRD